MKLPVWFYAVVTQEALADRQWVQPVMTTLVWREYDRDCSIYCHWIIAPFVWFWFALCINKVWGVEGPTEDSIRRFNKQAIDDIIWERDRDKRLLAHLLRQDETPHL